VAEDVHYLDTMCRTTSTFASQSAVDDEKNNQEKGKKILVDVGWLQKLAKLRP
jgi:hypothetical protein